MKELVLAHDLGTTGNKASLFDPTGALVASAFYSYETRYPRPGWAEQNPTDWWDAVIHSTRRLLSDSGRAPGEIAAVGFSGQMMGCLPVDIRGRPLSDAIIWADQRAQDEAAWLAERVGGDDVYLITGHRASPSYTAAKLLWQRARQPAVFHETHKVLQAKDYVAFKLTGVMATDYSDASGTNLFDLRARRWSETILEHLELPIEMLPPALPSATVIGGVTCEAADATGLMVDTPVVIGGGDGACATVGAGVVRPSDAYNYIGSSSWISYVSTEPLYDPRQRTFTFAHLDPRYLFPTGTMQCAGGSYDWLERLLRGDGERQLYHELDRLAESVPSGGNGLFYLPYLMGERSPHWNPNARACFVGLSMAHGRAEVARSVLEGVAYNLRTIMDAFRRQGAAIDALRVIGGGAGSAVWRQILADVLNVRLIRPRLAAEATSLGAAIAAGVGVGLLPDYGIASDWVAVAPGEAPRAASVAVYSTLYPLFCAAYDALAPLFDSIASIPEGEAIP
ncbi:MAG: xylulokinase [Anaerolineae bacterium]